MTHVVHQIVATVWSNGTKKISFIVLVPGFEQQQQQPVQRHQSHLLQEHGRDLLWLSRERRTQRCHSGKLVQVRQLPMVILLQREAHLPRSILHLQ